MDKENYDTISEKTIKDINRMREELGLSQIKVMKRFCLGCGRKFESLGAQHRMCRYCRRETENQFMQGAVVD